MYSYYDDEKSLVVNFFDMFEDILKSFSSAIDNMVNPLEEGTKGAAEITGETVKSTGHVPEKITESVKKTVTGSGSKKKVGDDDDDEEDDTKDDTVKPSKKAERNDFQNEMNTSSSKKQTPEPSPVTTSTVTNTKNTPGKAGFCFIGEDNGYRSCASVNESDKCMSGQVFDSLKKCQYPNARYDS